MSDVRIISPHRDLIETVAEHLRPNGKDYSNSLVVFPGTPAMVAATLTPDLMPNAPGKLFVAVVSACVPDGLIPGIAPPLTLVEKHHFV